MTFVRAVVVLTLISAAWLRCGSTVEVPQVDSSGMEPQVAERIERSRQAVLSAPGSPDAWGSLGMDFHAHDLFPEAVTSYQRAGELAPGDYRWAYLEGFALSKSDLAATVTAFERAAALRPDNPGFYVNFGDVLARVGEPARAREQYETVLAMNPRLTHALYGLGLLAVQEGKLEEARSRLVAAVEIAPHHSELHRLLAQVHQRLGDTAAAELAALRARAYPEKSSVRDPVIEQLRDRAVSSRAHSRRGLTRAREGRYAEAEVALRRVLALREGNARDFANLGGVLAGQGRLDEAIESYQQSLALNPEETLALNNLALARMGQGRLDEAADHLRGALRIDPLYADAHFNLALVRQRQGALEQAMEHYREALRVNPVHRGAHNNLARALAERGALEQAVELWRQVVEIDPLNLEGLYNLAQALAGRGEHAAAIGLLRQAMRHAPNSSLLSQALAWQLATAPDPGLRDGPRAVELAARVYAQYPDRPEAVDVYGAALAEVGDFKQAAKLAERALKQATAGNQILLAEQIRYRLEKYRKAQPFHQPQGSPAKS